MLWLWPFDRGIRETLGRFLRKPGDWLRRLHLQSIMIISPVEILADGRQNMCDGCPDMTVWNGELAWSCRLEECIHFGQFTRTVPRNKECTPEVVLAGLSGQAIKPKAAASSTGEHL